MARGCVITVMMPQFLITQTFQMDVVPRALATWLAAMPLLPVGEHTAAHRGLLPGPGAGTEIMVISMATIR